MLILEFGLQTGNFFIPKFLICHHDEANISIDLIEERYQKGVVLITFQVHPAGWGATFADPAAGEAIVDR